MFLFPKGDVIDTEKSGSTLVYLQSSPSVRLHNLLERMIVSSKQNSYPTLSQHVIELNFKSMQYL